MNETKLDVEDLSDVSTIAAALGIRCSVAVSPSLRDHVDPRVALSHLRSLLAESGSDPELATFRAVVLRGEAVEPKRADPDAMRGYVSRCKAGIGGVSPTGTILACHLHEATPPIMMVCQLGFGIVRPGLSPAVVLTTPDAANFYIESIAARTL